jgi:hypothetical protein
MAIASVIALGDHGILSTYADVESLTISRIHLGTITSTEEESCTKRPVGQILYKS